MLDGLLSELQATRAAVVQDRQADLLQLEQLKPAKQQLIDSISLAKQRLQARKHKPAAERVRDVAEKGLEKEAESLQLHKMKLDARAQKLGTNAAKLAQSIKAVDKEIKLKQACLEIDSKCVGLLTMHQKRALRWMESKNKLLGLGFSTWKACLSNRSIARADINTLVSHVMAVSDWSKGGEREVSIKAVRELFGTPLEQFAEWLVGTGAYPKIDKWRKFNLNANDKMDHRELGAAVESWVQEATVDTKALLEQLAAAQEQDGDKIAKAVDRRMQYDTSLDRLQAMMVSKNLSFGTLYTYMDVDRSDTITRQEFTDGLKAAGVDWHYTEIEDLFDEIDTDHSGWISTQELKDRLADSTEGVVQSPASSPRSQKAQSPTSTSQPIEQRKEQAKQRARQLVQQAKANKNQDPVAAAVIQSQISLGMPEHAVSPAQRQHLRVLFSSLAEPGSGTVSLAAMGRFDGVSAELQRSLFQGIESLPATDQVELGRFMAFWEAQVGLNGWESIRSLTHQMLAHKCGQPASCGEGALTDALRKVWAANASELVLLVVGAGTSIGEAELIGWAKQYPSSIQSLLPNSELLDEWQGGYCRLLGLPAGWTILTSQFISKVVDTMQAAYLCQ